MVAVQGVFQHQGVQVKTFPEVFQILYILEAVDVYPGDMGAFLGKKQTLPKRGLGVFGVVLLIIIGYGDFHLFLWLIADIHQGTRGQANGFGTFFDMRGHEMFLSPQHRRDILIWV